MAVLAVSMVVQTGHHDRSTGAATGRRCKGVQKNSAVSSDGIDAGCHSRFVAVATERGALVVGDEKNDVSLRRVQSRTDQHQQ